MFNLRYLELNLSTNVRELMRYGIVGIVQNSAGYIIYLLLTWIGLDPKIVVAFSYPIAMYISYQGNKKFTFSGVNGNKTALKYLLSHFIAYLMNLLFLYYFSDVLGYPHQIVQLISIGVVSIYLFIAFKLYVFYPGRKNEC